MILTVTPNPALDVTYEVDALVPGASLRVDAPRARAGGKGVNVARVLRQAGAEATAILTAGGPVGQEVVDDLEASGLPHLAVAVSGGTRRSVAIVDRAAGDTTILNEHGHALDPVELAALFTTVRAALPRATCVVASGSLPPGAPDELYADVVRDARSVGTPAVIDATGTALLAACAAGADLVKPNREELVATTGVDDPVRGARRLLDAGARRVVVTLGAEGLLALDAADPDRVFRARLPRPLRGNPTGAGDAAVAAAALGLAEGLPFPELLRRAVAWSAAAVLAPQAGELTPGYAELLPDVVLHEEHPCP